MRFVVSSGDLLRHLQIAGRAIASKSPVPILDNFLFSIEGNKLSVTGSDSEIIVVTTLELSEADHDGRVAIPGSKIIEHLKLVSEEPIVFNIDDNNYSIEMQTSTGNYKQAGLSADDYPQVKELDSIQNTFNISSDALLAGINHTIFATANDDLRPIMNGVFFDIQPEQITFVATDTHILARYTRTDVNTGIESSLVLGKKPANLLKNILSAGDQVTVSYDSQSAIFRTSQHTIVCRLTNGTYPNYRSVIPSENPYHVIVNRQDLSKAISREALYADGTKLVKLELSADKMSISAQDLNFASEGQDTIACQYEGIDISIGFKSSYFLNILSNLTSTDIEIQLSDPSRAALVIPSEKQDYEDELMLIMPMRV